MNMKEMTFEELKSEAEQGNAEAMVELGLRYLLSNVEEEQGRIWLERAAALGNDKAQYHMSFFYRTPEERVEWYKKSAEQGNVEALIQLGRCYLKGEGVVQNGGEALRLFHDAEKRGSAEAAFLIGKCYQEGEGVSQNDQEAIAWFRKGADYLISYERLEIYCRRGIGDVLPEEIVQYHQMRAGRGKVTSQRELGRFYDEGFGVEKNREEAIKHYKEFVKGVQSLDEKALDQADLARRYEEGDGVEQNLDEALRLYRAAAGAERTMQRIENSLRRYREKNKS